jgi:hypothetical protein
VPTPLEGSPLKVLGVSRKLVVEIEELGPGKAKVKGCKSVVRRLRRQVVY